MRYFFIIHKTLILKGLPLLSYITLSFHANNRVNSVISLCKMSLITRQYASFHNMIKQRDAQENTIPTAQNQIFYNMVYAKMQDDVYKLRRTMIDIVRRGL
jgi:hypothetical protein